MCVSQWNFQWMINRWCCVTLSGDSPVLGVVDMDVVVCGTWSRLPRRLYIYMYVRRQCVASLGAGESGQQCEYSRNVLVDHWQWKALHADLAHFSQADVTKLVLFLTSLLAYNSIKLGSISKICKHVYVLEIYLKYLQQATLKLIKLQASINNVENIMT